MKEYNMIRNLAFALAAFLLWGNAVCLLLPAEEYAAIVRALSLTLGLFLAEILIIALIALLRERAGRRGLRR